MKRTSVIYVVILSIITGGIYLPIWFLTRLDQFNRLQSGEKLTKGSLVFSLVAFAAAFCISLYSGLAVFFLPDSLSADPAATLSYADLIANTVSLVAILPLVRQTFRVKRMLLDHYRVYLQQNVSFSSLLTLLFLNFYLQYKINQLAVLQGEEG